MINADGQLILDAIEAIVGDDACGWWELEAAAGVLDERAKEMQAKLSTVYRIVHGANPLHPCHRGHSSWRVECYELARAVYEQDNDRRDSATPQVATPDARKRLRGVTASSLADSEGNQGG